MKVKIAAILLLSTFATAQNATISRYGSPCGGTYFSVDLPKLGSVVSYTVQNNDALLGFASIGVASVAIPIGNGCTIYTTNNIIKTFFSNLGTGGGVFFTVPNDTTLIGVSFYSQAVSFDSGGHAWTDGIKATIGR